jgi:hypothetical protein
MLPSRNRRFDSPFGGSAAIVSLLPAFSTLI